ncbi:hypothetical protein BDFB_015134, partial [Asbolus verrucosus]
MGARYSQLSRFCGALDIPQMCSETYRKTEIKLLQNRKELTTTKMVDAGKEEHRLAIEAGEID